MAAHVPAGTQPCLAASVTAPKGSSALPKSPHTCAVAAESSIAGLSLWTQQPWDPLPAGDVHRELPSLCQSPHEEQTYLCVLILGLFRVWHHQLNGHELEQTPGDGEEQGSLACCGPRGHKESDMTERLN